MFTPTEEQQSIIDFVATLFEDNNDFNSIGIKAFAGCGKSTVLKHIAQLYKTKQILGLAFNVGIVSGNKKEFPKRNTKWFTVHGFAREYLKKFGAKIDIDNSVSDYKPLELIDILEIKDQGDYSLGSSIRQVMKVYCQSSLKSIDMKSIYKAAKSQINHDVLNMNNAHLTLACEYANKLWDKMANNEIASTYDFYLKYFEVNRFAERITEFDIMELDEAQDSNAVTMSIVTQLPTKNIYVGDEHQSIYAFRGTLNALDYADKVFYLSTTFRYTQKIADFAFRILKGYKGEKVPIKSLANTNRKIDGCKAYISRNNSSMIELIGDMIDEGTDFKTVKKPDDLFGGAIALLEFRLEKTVNNDKFRYLKRFQDFEEVEEYIVETNDNELKTAHRMQLRYGKRLYTLLKVAKANFRSKEKITNILTTAHTSKGLEWDEVELMNDFPDIMRLLQKAKIESTYELLTLAKENDPAACSIIQEINLYYVAITRARDASDELIAA